MGTLSRLWLRIYLAITSGSPRSYRFGVAKIAARRLVGLRQEYLQPTASSALEEIEQMNWPSCIGNNRGSFVVEPNMKIHRWKHRPLGENNIYMLRLSLDIRYMIVPGEDSAYQSTIRQVILGLTNQYTARLKKLESSIMHFGAILAETGDFRIAV